VLISIYAVPRVSLRFWPVLLRNWLVWRKLAVPSMIGNVAEPLITLVAFGYGLGQLVGQVQGLPYIEFLASGSVVVSAALAATFEALYSAFSRMHVQKTWDSIMNAPVQVLLPMATLAAYACCGYFIALVLTRRRFFR
jgi:lipooligosaccharide transport system permease protein